MKITENRLRSIIRGVIKETMGTPVSRDRSRYCVDDAVMDCGASPDDEYMRHRIEDYLDNWSGRREEDMGYLSGHDYDEYVRDMSDVDYEEMIANCREY